MEHEDFERSTPGSPHVIRRAVSRLAFEALRAENVLRGPDSVRPRRRGCQPSQSDPGVRRIERITADWARAAERHHDTAGRRKRIHDWDRQCYQYPEIRARRYQGPRSGTFRLWPRPSWQRPEPSPHRSACRHRHHGGRQRCHHQLRRHFQPLERRALCRPWDPMYPAHRGGVLQPR